MKKTEQFVDRENADDATPADSNHCVNSSSQ